VLTHAEPTHQLARLVVGPLSGRLIWLAIGPPREINSRHVSRSGRVVGSVHHNLAAETHLVDERDGQLLDMAHRNVERLAVFGRPRRVLLSVYLRRRVDPEVRRFGIPAWPRSAAVQKAAA